MNEKEELKCPKCGNLTFERKQIKNTKEYQGKEIVISEFTMGICSQCSAKFYITEGKVNTTLLLG